MNHEKIVQLLADTIEKDPDEIFSLDSHTKLLDIGMDSIRFIRFIVALEEEFNIEILDSDLLLSNFETMDMLDATLKKYFEPKQPLKKVLICDCDNVLWHGIAGEEHLLIDADTEALQKEILHLYHSGVLICLCSRNEAINIEKAFAMIDMPLKLENFVLSKIDQNSKAKNIQEIADELNLSTESFVFLDDSDYELGLINALLPDIQTIKVDYSDMSFTNLLKQCFQTDMVSDLNRTKQYREQKEREKEKLHCATVEEYNATLKTTVICELAKPEHAARIAELSQRTNQFNLSGKRYAKVEIDEFIDDCSYDVVICSVTDIYGDMGIVGTAIIHYISQQTIIESFNLSCRAFGREIETSMIDKVKALCGSEHVFGIFQHTDHNQRYQSFYKEHGVQYYAEL